MVNVNQLIGTISQARILEGHITIPQKVGAEADPFLIQGTFTTAAEASTGSLSIPYSGDGYPIAALVIGEYDSTDDGYDAFQNASINSVAFWAMNKCYKDVEPHYTNDQDEVVFSLYTGDQATIITITRGDQPTAYPSWGDIQPKGWAYRNAGAEQYPAGCVRFKSKNELSYCVTTGEAEIYGLNADTTYRYIIAYSSTEEG